MRTFRSNLFIPELVKNLLIINILLYFGSRLLLSSSSGLNLYDYLILHHFVSPDFQPYQLITHMFMHANFAHLFFNMFALFMFGSALERVWGPRKFLIFYILSGLGAALLHMGYMSFEYPTALLKTDPGMLGASGAVYGVLTAFALYWPNTELFFLFIPFPIKAKYAILFLVILELTLGFGNLAGDNIAHFAHLGGALIGFILVKIWNKTNKNSLY